MPHISVVVPVYSCAECLPILSKGLVDVLTPINPDFEIIFVNDESPDAAWPVISELASQEKRIKGINLSRNFGQHYAITAGLDYATGKWIVVMDCDLQDPPAEITKLYQKAIEGYDIVYGVSEFRGKKDMLSVLFRKLYFWIYDLLAHNKFKTENLSFYIISEKTKKNVVRLREQSRHISSLMRYVGHRIIGVPVEHKERPKGQSSYTFMKRFNLAMLGIVAYSSVLLRAALITGFIVSFLSFAGGVVIIVNKIFHYYNVPGWATIVTLILFSTGVLLSFLGIIGVYIEKIYLEVKLRPLYFIDELLNLEEKK